MDVNTPLETILDYVASQDLHLIRAYHTGYSMDQMMFEFPGLAQLPYENRTVDRYDLSFGFESLDERDAFEEHLRLADKGLHATISLWSTYRGRPAITLHLMSPGYRNEGRGRRDELYDAISSGKSH